jgi:hypothetical protein
MWGWRRRPRTWTGSSAPGVATAGRSMSWGTACWRSGSTTAPRARATRWSTPHLVVANRVQGPDGRWTALDGRDVYRHRRAADAVYRAALQRELTRSLGVAWTDADRHGNREVRGMPGELVRAFSKRTEQVNAEVERLESSGRLRTPRLVKWAVHATRKAKEHEAPETLYARWRAEAAERGTDPDALVRGVTGRVAARERDQAPSEALAAHPTLREDQAGMVRDACLDGAGVQVVVGRPGTGKTYTLGVARHAWQLGGYRVLAAAPTGIATVSLEAEGFEEVATVDRLQLELDRGGERLDARSVLVVDEAGMVGSRKLTRLLEHAQRTRAKVVLVGDDRQLAAIDAGGGFRALRLRLGASELTENRRQLHAWQREAIELVRQGEVDQAVELYRAHERVVAAGSKQELALALLNDWWRAWKEAEQDPTKDVVVLAARRDEVDRLNTYCQQVLAKHERLGTERLRVEDREVAIGDRVVCGRNALRQLGIANGSRGQVVGLDARARTLTVRLDGSEREVALPRWYLDGRAGAERNRRVDLAYATTGHRAQGLTKWRALVRVTGGEDVNWFTVQLSRARQDTRLYAVVGPEPHEAAGELDLPDVERGDAFTQFNRALGKDRSQRLALDTASTPDVRRLSTAELRRERDRLTGQLAEAPRDRSRELARARDRRVQAEAELAARREQHGTMLRRPGRGGERAGVQAGAEAVAAQQADRATRRERELRGHQQRRAGWLEQHAPLVGGYQQVVLALAWQRRARGLACEAIEQDRPGYLRDALGPVPESTRGKRAWRQAAAHIEEYRGVYPVTDPERALGPAPREAAQRADWQRATAAIERVHHKQRVAERDHQPTRMHSTRQQQSRRATAPSGTRPAGRVPSGPPASTTEGGPMARSHPHPDNERERFPLPWEDDDTPGVSVHALTRADVEAILAQMPDEPDTDPPLRLPSLRRAAAARQDRRALGTPGASAQAEYRRRRQVEYAAWARTLPLADGRDRTCGRRRRAGGDRGGPADACRPAGRHGDGGGGLLAAAVPAQPRDPGVAARRRRRTPRRPTPGTPGPARLGRQP